MKKEKKKKVKVIYVDDGRTVYDMSGVTRPGQVVFPEKREKTRDKEKKDKRKDERVGLSKKEQWAAIKAAYSVYFPVLLGVLACFSLAAVILYFLMR